MTDAQQTVPNDRRPEWDDGQPHRSAPTPPLAAKPAVPVNPWLATLTIAWIVLLAVAEICAITGTSLSASQWDGNGTDPAEVASAMWAVANAAFLAAIPVFAIWVAVKAILWKAPARSARLRRTGFTAQSRPQQLPRGARRRRARASSRRRR